MFVAFFGPIIDLLYITSPLTQFFIYIIENLEYKFKYYVMDIQ